MASLGVRAQPHQCTVLVSPADELNCVRAKLGVLSSPVNT